MAVKKEGKKEGAKAGVKKVARKRRAAEVEEEEEEFDEFEDEVPVAVTRMVKVSNCSEAFNDVALYDMIGDELSRDIVKEGVTWAVHREGLKFAGFGWVEFKTVKAAKQMMQYDCMGAKSAEGRKANGDDLFISFHDDELPTGVCGWCGEDGHYARECHMRKRGAPMGERPKPRRREAQQGWGGGGGKKWKTY